LVSVGRFERRKNQLEIIRAAHRLGLAPLFIGRPNPTEPQYLSQLQATGDDRLDVWVDPPRAVVDWALAESQVHVLATRHETIGLVSLEAASLGARPVAIDQPTSRDYLLPFGELAASPDPADLTRAIERALQRGRLSEAEKALLGNLTWDAMAEVLEKHYRSILEKRAEQGSRAGGMR
jgi:glycosyltransferase involved in cell wall biosynthesis